MTTKNKLYFQAEKEAIFLILTGIGDEIYSTVDACNTAKEMWTAIERLQQGESLNVQDVKTNLFWEFGGSLLLEMENPRVLITPGCFDVQKHFQHDVNDIRSERLAQNANPTIRGIRILQEELGTPLLIIQELYKPTNNNLRTSLNSRNKTEDTTPRYNNDNQSGKFGNQRTMTVAGARETVGSPVVQQNGIQCFNCKGFGHYARECRKPKRVKDYA
ncbi:retrovirus-related pol polyprotein from transposon TNT 1-94 [Tanacetum coccineum]